MDIIDRECNGLYIIMQLAFAKDGTYTHHGLSNGDIISITPKIIKKVYCIDKSEFDLMMIDIINRNIKENKKEENKDIWLMHYFVRETEYPSNNGIFNAINDGTFYNRTVQELFMNKFYNSAKYRSALIKNNILFGIEDKLNMDETVHLRFRTEVDNFIERLKGYYKVDMNDINLIFNKLDLINKAILKIKERSKLSLSSFLKQEDYENLEDSLDKIGSDYDILLSVCEDIKGKINEEGYYVNKETGELENDYRK